MELRVALPRGFALLPPRTAGTRIVLEVSDREDPTYRIMRTCDAQSATQDEAVQILLDDMAREAHVRAEQRRNLREHRDLAARAASFLRRRIKVRTVRS